MSNVILIITVIALVVIAAGAVIYTAPARALAKRQLSQEDYKQLLDTADTGVRWAKQWLNTKTGAEKKEEAHRYLEVKTGEVENQVIVEGKKNAAKRAQEDEAICPRSSD